MSFHLHRLAGSTALTLVLSLPAHADVTPEDVWQNAQDYIAVFSPKAAGTSRPNGNGLSVSEMVMTFELPMDSGTLAVRMPGYDLTPRGDGTVSVVYPDKTSYVLTVALTGRTAVSGTLEIAHPGLVTIASGTPGDVTYTYSVPRMEMSLAPMQFESRELSSLSLAGTIDNIAGSTRIAVGREVSVTNVIEMGAQEFSSNTTAGSDVEASSTGNASGTTVTGTMVLPRGGMDIMNLAAALEQGLVLEAQGRTTGYATRQTSRAGGRVIMDQTSSADAFDQVLSLDAREMRIEGTVDGLGISGTLPDIPLPIELNAATASGLMRLPVSASDAPQPLDFAFSLAGVTVAEQLWGLLDPAQQLPRDPITLTVDLSSTVTSMVNWLNFPEMESFGRSGRAPGEVNTVTINDVTLSAAGAELRASGGATLDNSDTATFGGMPKPVGAVDISLKGSNTLMDTLVNMGLLSAQDVMGARMMMGAFTMPDQDGGEDALKSRIEFNEAGQILANGQRLR